MPQIEDVRGAGGGCIRVRLAKAVQHPGHFSFYLRRLGKQHIGVYIALQRLARAAHSAAHQRARLGQVHGPVQAQHLAVERGHVIKPQATALGKHQTRNLHAIMFTFELGQHAFGVGQAELLKSTVGQHAAPAVKNHHRLRAGFNLRVQVRGHRIGVHSQHAVHQVGALVQHGLDQAVVVRARAFDHVASQRPGAARKTDQRHPAIECLANRGDRVKHIAQLGHVGHFEFGHGRLVAHGGGELRALAQRKRQAQAHGVRHRQDVRKQNGRVQRVTLQRLQRHFGGVVGVGGQPHETTRLGPRGAVLGQIAPGLAHQPDRGVGSGLAPAGAQKGIVL